METNNQDKALAMEQARHLMRMQGITEDQIDRQIAIDRKNAINGKCMFALPIILNNE